MPYTTSPILKETINALIKAVMSRFCSERLSKLKGDNRKITKIVRSPGTTILVGVKMKGWGRVQKYRFMLREAMRISF